MTYTELTSPKEVKPRKQHECGWCGQRIDKGERCMYRSYVFDDRLRSEWEHVDCWEAMLQSDFDGPEDEWAPGDQGRGCLRGGFESDGARVAWPQDVEQ